MRENQLKIAIDFYEQAFHLKRTVLKCQQRSLRLQRLKEGQNFSLAWSYLKLAAFASESYSLGKEATKNCQILATLAIDKKTKLHL